MKTKGMTPMPKVVLFLDSPAVPTGYGSTCRLTARELKKRGWDVYGISFNGGPQLNEIFEQEGIKVLPNYALQRDGNANYGDAETVKKIYRDIDPDVLFFHNDTYRYSYLIDVVKECPEIGERSVFWLPYEGESPDERGASILASCAVTRFVTKHAMSIHQHMMQGKDLGIISHAIDLDAYSPLHSIEDKKMFKARKSLGIDNKFVVVRVDRYQPRKKWDITVRSFAKFAEGKDDVFLFCKCNPRDISMFDKHDGTGVDLEQLANSLGLKTREKIFFDDYFFSSQFMPVACYYPADVFLTTTSGEGFGLAVAEAMACGTPIIYGNVPVLPEVVGEGGLGCAIKTKDFFGPLKVWHNVVDIDEVASKLEWAYNDWKNNQSKELNAIGQKGKDISTTKYNPTVVYDEWDKVMRSIIEKKSITSIVTVMYNLKDEQLDSKEYGIQLFLESMNKYVTSPYEWIIVDNGSPAKQKTREWLEKACQENPNIKPVYLDTNLGFAGANNVGIALANGKNVILCNPDSQALNPATHGWGQIDFIGALNSKAESDDSIGIVGIELSQRNDILNDSIFPYFCCVLLTRRCLNEIKLTNNKWLDESFWPAYYEDLDLTFRAMGKGFKVAELNCPFYHVSGGTNRHAIEGGKDGASVAQFLNEIDILKARFPDMTDWKEKESQTKNKGMHGLIEGNIRKINDKFGIVPRSKIKIVFETYIGAGVGFSLLVEGLAPALDRAGFDVYINDLNRKNNVEDPNLVRLIDKYTEANGRGEIENAIHIVFWLMETYQKCQGNYKVGVSLCESDKVRPSYLNLCNGMDRILTYSNFCKQVQINSGFKVPIDVMPPGVHEKFIKPVNRTLGNKFSFLSVGVSQTRKDMRTLVEGFCEAFPLSQDYPPEVQGVFPLKCNQVELVLKSNNFGDLEWVSKEGWDKRANIRCIFTGWSDNAQRKDFTLDEMYDLYASAHCLVHPSHGEGIGMPILEGAGTGLPVIFTNWSSPAEYLDESNSYPCQLNPLNEFSDAYPEAGPAGENGKWANIHKSHMKHLMVEVVRNYQAACARGLNAAKKIAKYHSWEHAAKNLIPLIFEWEKDRVKKNPTVDFDPYVFKAPKLDMVKTEDRILIDCVTRDRHSYFCSLLTSLLTQTFKNWDIIIQCDDKDDSIRENFQINSLLSRLRYEGHNWEVARSHKQGPHVAHDRTLKMAMKRDHKLICRIDDDIWVQPDYLQKMFEVFLNDEKCEIAAVGGVYLDPKRSDHEQMAPKGFETDIHYAGKIEPNEMWPFVCHYPPGTPIREVEHLHSSFLYRKQCGYAIGGYFKNFSSIGHREESDFSYRFHLAGWKQYIHPEAKGFHYRCPFGGIRSEDIVNKNNQAMSDEMIYRRRLEYWNKRIQQKKLVNGSALAEPASSHEAIKEKTVGIFSSQGATKEDIEYLLRFCSTIIGSSSVESSVEEARSKNFKNVIILNPKYRFIDDPLSFISPKYNEYVFDVHKSYAPGYRKINSFGVAEFIVNPSMDKLIGPECEEKCLIKNFEGEPSVLLCNSVVVEDINMIPVLGMSEDGRNLIPIKEIKKREWKKVPKNSMNQCIEKQPEIKEKMVSIIIPTPGRIGLLQRCVDTIYAKTKTKFEIVFVDNGSKDGTAGWLKNLASSKNNITVLTNESNVGFQKAVNQAVSVVKGEYILIFNDDAWVEDFEPSGKDWLAVYVNELDANPKLGLVGPHRWKSPTFGINMLFFWCVMFRKSLWNEVGALDERFFNYCGDDDYCKRVIDKGYKIKTVPTRLRHLMTCVPSHIKEPELKAGRTLLEEKYNIKDMQVSVVESKPKQKSVMFYSFGQGFGHVSRTLSLGRIMSKMNYNATLLTDSEAVGSMFKYLPLFQGSSGLPTVKVEGCDISFIQATSTFAAEVLSKQQPDILCVDLFANGIYNELSDFVKSFKGIKVLIHQQLKEKAETNPSRVSCIPVYDAVIVTESLFTYGHPKVVKTEPWVMRDKNDIFSRENALKTLKCDGNKKIVVFACSGTKDEADEMAILATKVMEKLKDKIDIRVFSPYRQNGTEKYWPLLELFSGIDLLIGQGGYSTAHEVRMTGMKFLGICKERSFEDQALRLLKDQIISESHLLTNPEAILMAIPESKPNIPNYENGVYAALACIKELEGKR